MAYNDYQGVPIRMPAERLAHVFETHEYMIGLEWAIRETLEQPKAVVGSTSDPEQVRLHYRRFDVPVIEGRYICVVVKVQEDDAFVLTAYITDNLKSGELL